MPGYLTKPGNPGTAVLLAVLALAVLTGAAFALWSLGNRDAGSGDSPLAVAGGAPQAETLPGVNAGEAGSGFPETGFSGDTGAAAPVSTYLLTVSSPGADSSPPPPLFGILTGLVTGDGMAPLANVLVYLAWKNGADTGSSAFTDTAGKFAFSGLSPGSYKLYFSHSSGEYEPSWYGSGGGSAIDVEADRESQVAHAMMSYLPYLGKLSGRVTVAGGSGIGGVVVYAFMYAPPEIVLEPMGTGVTGPTGEYMIGNLPASGYKVFFSPPSAVYASQWYEGEPTPVTAETLPLSPGDTIGKVNAELQAAAPVLASVATAAAVAGNTADSGVAPPEAGLVSGGDGAAAGEGQDSPVAGD